jgi:5-formyltetrahydrofolate cyclo-ligase
MNTKNEIRKHYLDNRKDFSDSYIKESTQQINQKLTSIILEHAAEGAIIALYVALDKEINLANTIQNLHSENLSLALPWVNYQEREMYFKLWHYNEPLEKLENFYCFQPKEHSKTVTPSIIVAPLITCDTQGNRIGYGKGYYDKYLNNPHSAKPLVIGVCYNKSIYPSRIPSEKHDYQVDILISEEQVIQTR